MSAVRIKKGDTVKVIAGKDKGKTGKARIKKTRWTLAGALIATAAGIAASVILARYC